MAKAATPAEIGVVVGQVFLDKYRVDAILGHGGMGVVVACTHLGLNERFAMKMLRLDVLSDVDAVERFQREARAASKLKSEYVARVIDVGELDNGVPYMLMEYLDGLDLGVLLEERGVLQPPWASELMLQTCEALAEAHAHGIVHRDVKPTNLFVTWRPDGSALVKVLDFGISKSATGTDMHLTQTQSVLGTPAYMSPEQMRSARLVDSRSDIWSLGSVFYELLEGRRPFEADSFSEMCVKVAVDPPTPMQNTPYPLQQVILRCLEKAPENRYPNMATLAADLVPFIPDPHQGQVLVERMARLLRRSGGTWDGDSTSSARAMPLKDIKSGPVRSQSQPVSAWHPGSDPAGIALTPRPGSMLVQAPIVPAHPTTTLRTARRRWPIAAAIAVALSGGSIAALVVNSSSSSDEPAHENAPPPQTATQAPAPTVQDPPKQQAAVIAPTGDGSATSAGKTTPPPSPQEVSAKAPVLAPADNAKKMPSPTTTKVTSKNPTTTRAQHPKQTAKDAAHDTKVEAATVKKPELAPVEPPKNLKCGLEEFAHDYDRDCRCPGISQKRCGGKVITD